MNKIVGDIIAGSESVGDKEDLNVNSRVAESVLAPQASDIKWEDLGNGKILLNVTGQNYIDGLSVQAGDKIIATPADGLAVKNDGSFMLLLAAQTLGQTTYPYLLGRYGAPVPLLRFNSKESQELPGYGLKILSAEAKPINGSTSKVEIVLEPRIKGETMNFYFSARKFLSPYFSCPNFQFVCEAARRPK